MSIRMRSLVGSILVCAGVLLLIAAAVAVKTSFLWTGLGAAGAGVALVVWAIRDAAREIRAAESKFDALLRAQLSERGKEAGPGEQKGEQKTP